MPRCSQNLRIAWKASLCRIRSKTSKTKLLAFLRPPSRSIRSSIAFGGRFKSFASCRISADFHGTVSAFSVMLWLCLSCHDLLALVSNHLWLKVATLFRISSHPSAIETSSHWPMALLGHLHLRCTEATTLTPTFSRTKNVPYNTDFMHNHVESTSQQGLSLGNMMRWNALEARNISQVPMSFHDMSCQFWEASSTIIPGPERWSSSTGSFTLVSKMSNGMSIDVDMYMRCFPNPSVESNFCVKTPGTRELYLSSIAGES